MQAYRAVFAPWPVAGKVRMDRRQIVLCAAFRRASVRHSAVPPRAIRNPVSAHPVCQMAGVPQAAAPRQAFVTALRQRLLAQAEAMTRAKSRNSNAGVD